jgi:hypothetical protein
MDERRYEDWKSALREFNAAIANYLPLLKACDIFILKYILSLCDQYYNLVGHTVLTVCIIMLITKRHYIYFSMKNITSF